MEGLVEAYIEVVSAWILSMWVTSITSSESLHADSVRFQLGS
jgi:hypothetical protein